VYRHYDKYNSVYSIQTKNNGNPSDVQIYSVSFTIYQTITIVRFHKAGIASAYTRLVGSLLSVFIPVTGLYQTNTNVDTHLSLHILQTQLRTETILKMKSPGVTTINLDRLYKHTLLFVPTECNAHTMRWSRRNIQLLPIPHAPVRDSFDKIIRTATSSNTTGNCDTLIMGLKSNVMINQSLAECSRDAREEG
jgi:hypothetical protein